MTWQAGRLRLRILERLDSRWYYRNYMILGPCYYPLDSSKQHPEKVHVASIPLHVTCRMVPYPSQRVTPQRRGQRMSAFKNG